MPLPEYGLQLSDAELRRYQAMAEDAARTERDRWAAAGVVEAATVADIGCGPGAVAVVIARFVGPAGRVIAVDGDPDAVAAAAAAATRAGLDNVDARIGDAGDTGIAPGTVDTVMIRHVLAHNGGREQAIVSHAAGLLRPGGGVYLFDVEGAGLRVRPSDPDLDDLNLRYQQWHHQRGNDLSVGLRLAELLAGAGLEVVEFDGRYRIMAVPPGLRPASWAARQALIAAGLADDDDVARWASALEQFDRRQPRPTMFIPQFSAIGRRPAI